MKLRIVSGSLGGRYITLGKKTPQDFRPTQERVRQAVAETIKNRIPEAVVLDLCAGSGAFGFEMASRGAKEVHFIESDSERCRSITHHASLFGIEDTCTVIRTDARKFVSSCSRAYDIVFYDPPYEDAMLAQLAGKLPALLSECGILIYERDVSEVPPSGVFPPDEVGRETREYGDTAVEFITRKPRK
jgi:16S rRNA (guanine966-N2)-methyltransferase